MTRAVRPLAAAISVAIAAASFTLSFAAISAVAAASGAVTPELAWLVPLVLDGLIVAATSVAWARARDDEPCRFAVAAVAAAASLSIAINIAHASRSGAMAYLIAAIPPVALVVSLELVGGELRRARRPAASPDTAEDGEDTATRPVPPTSHPDVPLPDVPPDVPPDAAPPGNGHARTDARDVAAMVADWTSTGRDARDTDLRRLVEAARGVTARQANRLLAPHRT